MTSCLRGTSLFRRRDSFEEEDVGGKGVVKKIPIEMKQRRTLAPSLRSVGSFGPKRQKGASLRSALSVELDGQETEKVKKEFEMYRLNKENEIANFKKKEQKLENENRRLRGELQAMQKTVAKLLYERDEAFIDVQQALERSATFEAERDKIQRQFKIFREGKEEELQTILRTKRELERRLSSNRGRPGTGGNNANVALNNIVETESSNHHSGYIGDIPETGNHNNTIGHPHQHRNSVDWWMMGQSPCFDREPSIGSLTQLHTSMTLPGNYGGNRAFLGSAAVHRKVSSTSSLLFGGKGAGGGVIGGEGLAGAEVVSVSQFGTSAGLDVGGGCDVTVGKDDWTRLNVGGGGSLGQSRNSQIGYEPLNPSINDDHDLIASSSVIRLYASAPSDVRGELQLFHRRFVPRLQRMCARQGRTLLFVYLPPDEDVSSSRDQPADSSADCLPASTPSTATTLESVDIEVSAALHHRLPQSSALFLSFLRDRLDTFTKDEIHYGFLQKKDDQLLGAVFCLYDEHQKMEYDTTGDHLADGVDSIRNCEMDSLKTEITEVEKFDNEDERSEVRKQVFKVSSPEQAVDEAGRAVEALIRQALGISDNLDTILSDDDVDDEMELIDDKRASNVDVDVDDFDRESIWWMRLTATSCQRRSHADLEQDEILRLSLDSVNELGFESHYQELTSHLTSAGPLPPLLVSGQPGTGKSLLLAKWLSLILEEKRSTYPTATTNNNNRSSAFYPPHHFPPLVLYHSVSDSQSISGSPHHALYRFTAKLLQHVSSSFSATLGRVTSNPARLVQEFPKLLESVSARLPGGVVIVLDHADRFQDAESQLSWLLDPLPVDVRVFVAADEDSCPKSWKSWPTLTVDSLSNNQIRDLLAATFLAAGQTLNPDCLNLIQRHCRSPPTTTPLYTSVLAAFLCWKSRFELELKPTVVEALEKRDCVELITHALKEIDVEYDGRTFPRGALRKILALIHSSRSGMSENDIFPIVGPLDYEKDAVGTNGSALLTIAWHRWAVVCDALIALHVLRRRGGVLTFANPRAREAVRRVYHFSAENVVEYRQRLVDYHGRNLHRRDPRTIDELLWLLLQVGDRERLRLFLRKIDVFVSLYSRGRTDELLRFWSVVVGANDKINALSSAYLEELKSAADAAEIDYRDGGDDDENEERSPMSLTRVAAIYEGLGRFFRNMAYFDHASMALERALELRESLDPDCAEVGRSLVQLAQLNAEWRKYSTAEALFRNALELFEGLYGSEHVEIASTLEATAILYQRQGKHDVARPLQRRADSIKLKKRRERIEIARAQSAQRRFGDVASTSLGNQACDGTEELDEFAMTSTNLATSATAVVNALASPSKRSVVERQKQIASTFFNHGVRLCQRNKHAAALPLFQGALTVFESALGSDHALVAKTLRNLALVKYHLGDFEAAAKNYKKAIEMRDSKPRDGSELLASSVEELDRQKFDVDATAVASAALLAGAESRRSSSDTMSTVKIGNDSFVSPRAASTR